MSTDMNFTLINNFRCKKCGSINYDKVIYTGNKFLEDEDAILSEQYVCRNCDYPINLQDYIISENIQITSNDLLEQATIIEEGD